MELFHFQLLTYNWECCSYTVSWLTMNSNSTEFGILVIQYINTYLKDYFTKAWGHIMLVFNY